jgi:hypothetical protein
MTQLKRWLRDVTMILGAFSIGWWAHSGRIVHASGDDFQAQLYVPGAVVMSSADQRTIFVYQGALTGSYSVQCTYKLELSSFGGVIRREQCPLQTMAP